MFRFCSSGPPRKRDSLWSWLVCACATVTWIASLGILFSYGVFLPVFMDYFKASREITACVGSVAIALCFFTGYFSTFLVTRFGCRMTALIGGAFCAVSLVASSFVQNILVLFFTYSLLFAWGSSCMFSAGLVVINQYFNKKKSLATGVLTAGHAGGVLIMGPALEALIKATGWQVTCRIMAGCVFALCSLAITFDPNVETDEEKSNLIERQASGKRKNENNSITAKIKTLFDFSVWKEPPVIALICVVCVAYIGHFVPQIHIIRFCEDLGISAERASDLLIYYGLCSAIGRLLAGFLCSHPRVNTFYVYQAAEFMVGLSTILMSLCTTYAPLTIYFAIYGLSDGVSFSSETFLILIVSPHKTTVVLVWEMMLGSLTIAGGPTLAGLLSDKLHSYVVPFQVAGGITLAASFIPFFLLCFRPSERTTLTFHEDEGEPLLNELNCSSKTII